MIKSKLLKKGDDIAEAMAEMGMMPRTPKKEEQQDYLLMRDLEDAEERGTISGRGRAKLAELRKKFLCRIKLNLTSA